MKFLKRLIRCILWYAGIWLVLMIVVFIICDKLPGPLQALLVLAWFIVPGVVARRKTKKKQSIQELRSEMNASSAKSAEQRKQAAPPPQPQPKPRKAQSPKQGGFGQMDGKSEEDMQKVFDMFFNETNQPHAQPAQRPVSPPPRPQAAPPPKPPEQPKTPPPPKAPDPPKIDINRAKLQDIESIPAVNKILARKILKLREEQGSFSSLQELFDKAALPAMVQEEITRRCEVRGGQTASGAAAAQNGAEEQGRIIDF